MVEIAVTDGVGLAAYDTQQNTRVRYDEVLELTGKNEFYNADLLDLDRNGAAVNTAMDSAPEPQGWAVSAQQLTPAPPGLETRQSLPAIPMAREAYTQIGPIIRGPGIPDQADRARMAQPLQPRLKVITDAIGGFQVGWMAVVFGWIVADTAKAVGAHVAQSPFITDASPRSYVQITSDGQVPRVWLPTTAPAGAVGLYIGTCAPQANQAAASVAELFIQRRIDTRQGQKVYYDLSGPLQRDEKVPLTNKSLVGAFQRWAAPERMFGHSDHGVMFDFTTRLSFRFSTLNGFSNPQNQTPLFQSRYIGEHKELRWRPKNLPSNAVKWQPIFKSKESYLALPWKDLDDWAVIRSTDPSHIGAATEKIKYADGRDNTGLKAPDVPIDLIEITGKSQLAIGQYRLRAWWYDDQGQLSPPSPPATDPATGRNYADITALGQTWRVFRPQYGNAIPNGNTSVPDRTSANQDPLDWTITRTANFSSITTATGQIKVVDTSGATTTETFALSPLTDIMADEPDDRWYTLRMGLQTSRYTGGRVAFRVLYYDKNEALLSTGALLGGIGGPASSGIYKASVLNDTVYAVARIAKGSAVLPTGVVRDEAIPATARYFRVEVRSVGATAGTGDGPRNMDYVVTGLGSLRGLTIPRRMPLRLSPVPDIESYDDFYPPGGSAAIELAPRNSKKHADLAGLNLNAFIYFGPYLTPNSPEYGITGLGTPVKPSTTKTLSIYASYDGVAFPTNAIHFSGYDAQGRAVQDFGYWVPNAAGSIAPTRFSKTLSIGPETVWIELDACNLSDGFWRIMAPQLEAGSSATAFSTAKASPGFRSWIFDTGAPGAPEDSVNGFLGAGRVIRGLTTALDGTPAPASDADYLGTAVTTTYATSQIKNPYVWSDPVSSPLLAPPGRYWKVTVTLTTSNLALSPIVSRAGLEVRRPWAVLLKSDGTEFPGGGCIVNSFPIVAGSRRTEEFISDSNEYDLFVSGQWLYEMNGVNLYCQSREGAEAVTAYRHSKRPFILESALRRKRIRAFAPEMDFQPVEDGLSWDAEAPIGHWDEQSAEGVVFRVMAEADLS